MNRKSYRYSYLSVLCVYLGGMSAVAQDNPELPKWIADKDVVPQLGEVFADSRISIRPPRNLQRVDQPHPPEMAKIGVYNYGWTPGGVFPSIENMSVVLAPYAQPSSAALDKTVEGMKKSVQQRLQDTQFGEVRKGRFGSIEVRLGKYTAQISGEKIIAFYLIGIDRTGTFSVTAMLPLSKQTPEKIEELKTAILTFARVK